MRPSILPAKQATRLCTFCQRQLQQHRRITTARDLQAPSTEQHETSTLAPAARPQISLSHIAKSSTTTRRAFTRSAHLQTSQPSTATASTSPSAGTDAAAAAATTQPRVPQTHYEFFPRTLPSGPPPNGPFTIDVRALRREFLGLQAGAHPDLHPSHLKARAQATSARINEAFRTLESPLLRAQYILSLRGLDVANDETAKVEDKELLMAVLEARECIEEAGEEEELEPLRIENEERISESEDRLQELFEKDDLRGAMAEVVRLRYWVNVRESIVNWEKGKPVVLEH
ncbi:Co-chaperone Hsc20 [Nemania sp. FL0031]|nr:Co-chaperone Hsc20 [Nemania sp. FL0031]